MAPTEIDLVLRLIKGSELTYEETDENFVKLRAAILALGAEYNASRFVFGRMPPPDERAGALWLPYTEPGYVDLGGFYIWQDPNWVRIREPVLYGVTTGSGGAYAVTLDDDLPSLSYLLGRFISLKIHSTNGGESTLNVTGRSGTPLGATPIRKGGNSPLVGQEMLAGSVVGVIYDGTNFNIVTDVPKGADPTQTSFYSYISPDVALPTSGGTHRFVHGLVHNGVPVAPSLIRVTLVRTADGQQTFSDGKWVVPKGAEIDASKVYCGRRGAENEWMTQAIRWSSDSEAIYVNALYPPSFNGAGGLGIIDNQFNGNGGPGSQAGIGSANRINPDDYKLRVYASAFNPQLLTSTSTQVDSGAGIVAPTISVQPTGDAVTEGAPVDFTVAATGSNLTYQWYKDGTSIAGATSATYTIASASESDEGDYTVIVSNSGGSVVSSTATLVVNPP